MNDSQDPINQPPPAIPPTQPEASPSPAPSTNSVSSNIDTLSAVTPSPTPNQPSDAPVGQPAIEPQAATLPQTPAPGPLPPIPVTPTATEPPTQDPASTNDADKANGNNFTAILWAFVANIFNWLVVPAAIVFVLHFFVFQAFHVVGRSMVPTLQESDYLIISKVDATMARISRVFGKSGDYIPKRNEIIVFRYPSNPQQIFVKRVIATPGERVVVKSGQVTVFNSTHPEGFNPDKGHELSDPITLGDVDETVQPGKVFVMGDNRAPGGSFDSRDWGELPSSNIIGKAILRLLPLDKFKVIND